MRESGSDILPKGRIVLLCGCMFSGKSERLVQWIMRARARGETVAAFKHVVDSRYAKAQIVTHNGLRIEATPIANASQIFEHIGDSQLVAIDEAQFFGDDLIDVCWQLAEQSRQVMVAGLDRDAWGQPFSPMPGLEAIADDVIRTRSVCARCGQEAKYTQRLVPVEGQAMIGGAESYEPRCAKCFQPPPIELRC